MAFLVGSPLADAPLLCFGLHDYVPGPHELLIGSVEGCPVYLDDRFRSAPRRLAVVLDGLSLWQGCVAADVDGGPALTARCIPLSPPAQPPA